MTKNVPQNINNSVSFDPWLLWIAFRTHWAWIVPSGFLLATLAALSVWFTFEPVFEATYIMEVNRDYVITQGLNTQVRDIAKSERNLITNAMVLDEVLADSRLQSAPSLKNPQTRARDIRTRLSVGNAGSENLLTISYRDKDPQMAAEICNAIAVSYLKVRRRFDEERFANVERWLNRPIEVWMRNVENLQTNLTELTKAANGYDPFKPSSKLENDASKAMDLRREIAQLDVAEVELEAKLFALQNNDKDGANSSDSIGPDLAAIEDFVSADRDVLVSRTKIAALVNSITAMEIKDQQQMLASRYKSLKASLKQAETELLKLEESARQRAIKVVSSNQAIQVTNARAKEIEAVNRELTTLRIRKSAFTEEYDEEKSRLEQMSGETAEIYFAQEDYRQAAEILSKLKERLETLRAERGRGSSINTMADAKIPAWPMEEVPFKKIIMASGAVFFLPFVLAIMLEFFVKRLTTAENLEANNFAPLVGEIARIPGGAKNSKDHRLFEESVDALRANVLFKLEGVRTIVITSAMPSEGKSSVASQLAISLAKASDSSVLIIDADLRSPDQHELFGLDNSPGLCKLLAGKATLAECIDKSLGDLVHVLPAGRLDANPHNLLTKKNLQKLFSQVKEKYRYIVVDTAPVLPAAESLVVAAEGDATLLCAMRDVSRSDHVKRTQRRLEACGANIIGTVFSGVPASVYAYRYGDYRYSKDASKSIT
jgi:polysaccharide biosynthesis transport protein